mmetsp:Transcript_110232/g.310966  ORF Transcript_110232/g.310966 Transcript_110232/m.310966 type:complete len:275 (-) Transcript_110232:263-1087(-)
MLALVLPCSEHPALEAQYRSHKGQERLQVLSPKRQKPLRVGAENGHVDSHPLQQPVRDVRMQLAEDLVQGARRHSVLAPRRPMPITNEVDHKRPIAAHGVEEPPVLELHAIFRAAHAHDRAKQLATRIQGHEVRVVPEITLVPSLVAVLNDVADGLRQHSPESPSTADDRPTVEVPPPRERGHGVAFTNGRREARFLGIEKEAAARLLFHLLEKAYDLVLTAEEEHVESVYEKQDIVPRDHGAEVISEAVDLGPKTVGPPDHLSIANDVRIQFV